MASIILLNLFVASATMGQETKTNCPKLSVTGPAGIVPPGDPAVFRAELKGKVPNDIKYEWTVEGGVIVSGQGTSSLTTTYSSQNEVRVTAEVKVIGLQAGCPDSASETFSMAICLTQPILVEEGSTPATEIDKPKLDTLTDEFEKHPQGIVYIIDYFPPKTTQSIVDRKIRMMIDYLTKQKGLEQSLEQSKIRIFPEVHDRPFTRYYVVPPGADFPTHQ